MTQPVKLPQLIQYSFIALPLAFAGIPLYIHAPDFYTRDLGMNIGIIGSILLVVRLFDAIQDPIIGYLSDRYAYVRYFIISIGMLMLTIGMAAIFYGPQMGVAIEFWFAISMILAATGFSVVSINLNMIGGFWSDDPNERTRISAYREGFTLLGLLFASILPTLLQSERENETVFEIVFWVFAGLTFFSFLFFSKFMLGIFEEKQKSEKEHAQKGFSFFKILIGPDRKFFFICFISHIAAAMPATTVLFFIKDYLGAGDIHGLFLIIYFFAGASMIGLWTKISSKIGKLKAWLVSIILSCVTFIWAFGLQPGDIYAYAIICFLSGTALGADLALPPSILADRITRQKTEAEATQYYALLAFIPKLALAIAAGSALMILEQFSFAPGQENSKLAMQALITIYALVPCIIKLFSALFLWSLIKQEGEKNEQIQRNSACGNTSLS